MKEAAIWKLTCILQNTKCSKRREPIKYSDDLFYKSIPTATDRWTAHLTEAIVNVVIAPHSAEVALERHLKKSPYWGVSTNCSNHGAKKLFPLLIQYFDWKNGGLQCKLVEIKSTPKESAETITKYIRETLEKKGIFSKCNEFTDGNCNTNFGGNPASRGREEYTHSGDREGEQFSVEVKKILDKIHTMLHERKTNNFMPLKVNGMLAQSRKMDLVKERWMAPMEEFSTFMWMDLSEIPDWKDAEGCIRYLAEKGVEIDYAKCFDQVTNLKKFIEMSNSDKDFSDLQAHQR
ncbi:unnamed protein product [Lepeophtheirus salmonis]|uniref:(salmon louse) hypothetical protein n=1 Tax=Lepeophtheirus salmonis TaxID=72036 RepID=A0A7R8CX63_LEPSM|nr:unnamed protein product [Lepeophtheirus salmonis]CAF2957526.1 unnamed protein product [Lepeophtheirus salmonis]